MRRGMTESVCEPIQVIKSVHHELFHALNRVIEFRIRGRLPNVCFSHLLRDELQTHSMSLAANISDSRSPTLRKSLMSLIWSETVKVRLAKLLKNLPSSA